MQLILSLLKKYHDHRDRHIRGHSLALYKRLQEMDQEEMCRHCEETHTDGIFHECPTNN